MHRGVVLDMTDSELVLLTPDGQFRKIPRTGRTCQVGEEILFSAPPSLLKRPWLSAMLALTAAVVFCFVLFSSLSGSLEGAKPIVAYVTLDINPSVEFGIDIEGAVRVARGLNTDGAGLLEGLTMQGIPLAAATEQLMAKVEEQGYLSGMEGDVIISSTKAYEKADIDEESLGQIVQTTVAKHIETKHPEIASNVQVAAFVTPPTIREEAISQGVSAGKYAVYLSAKDNGNDVQLDKLKNESVHTIAKAAGGWSQLLNSENLPKKEALSKLLEAERTGELDAKVKGKNRIAETNESDGEARGTIKPGAVSSARTDRDGENSERSGNDRGSDRTGRTEQDGKDERNSSGNRSNGSSRQDDDDRRSGRDDADDRGQRNEQSGNNGQQSGSSSGRGNQDNSRNEPIRQDNASSSNNQWGQTRQGSQNQGSQGQGNRNESSPNQGSRNQNNQNQNNQNQNNQNNGNRGNSNQGNRAGGGDQTPLKPVQTSSNGQDRGKQEEERINQEDARKKQEEERQQEEERKNREDEQKKQEEPRGKEQDRKKQEEERKKQEEERKKQEELRKKQEEERKKQEEQKRWEERERQEQEGNKLEELRKKQEEERRKQEQQRRDS